MRTYSPDELCLIAIQAVSDQNRIDKVIGSLAKLDPSVIAFIRHHFETELLKVVKAKLKDRMVELITQGKTAFINEGKTGLTVKSQFLSDLTKQMSDNGVQAPEEWNTELQRFFHLLMSRFIPSGERLFHFNRSVIINYRHCSRSGRNLEKFDLPVV